MKKIPLTQGQFALVDDSDYEFLSQWKWYANKLHGNFYAMRGIKKGGKQFIILMHRQILGLEKEDKRQGDHKDHNTLDNRRSNLRICTNQQNLMNMKSHQNTTSRFKGVSWVKSRKKWVAQITINGTVKFLGRFTEEKEAAEAYDEVAKKHFEEFACLNFQLGGV